MVRWAERMAASWAGKIWLPLSRKSTRLPALTVDAVYASMVGMNDGSESVIFGTLKCGCTCAQDEDRRKTATRSSAAPINEWPFMQRPYGIFRASARRPPAERAPSC